MKLTIGSLTNSYSEIYALDVHETSSEAKAELLGWIDQRTVVDYWLVYQMLSPDGLVNAEKQGLGTLRHEIDNVIILKEPSSQEIVVTSSGREVIDYCEPQAEGEGYKVQVRSLNFNTWMAFKPSEYTV